MIEQAIRETLTGDSTISSLTGNRIRPLISAQDDEQPRLAYQVTANDPVGTFTGPSAWSNATVEIDIITDTYRENVALAAELKRVFDWTRVITSQVRISPSKLTDETDTEQAVIDGTEQPVYLRTLTFEMQYRALVAGA